jgi:hypothetical protein
MNIKFNKLKRDQQIQVALTSAMFAQQAPEDFYLPEASPDEWIQAYSALNPKIHPNSMPSAEDFADVVEYIETVIQGHIPGVCPCCNTYVPATPSVN